MVCQVYCAYSDEYQLKWKDNTIDTIGTKSQVSGRAEELTLQGYELNEDFYITKYFDD